MPEQMSNRELFLAAFEGQATRRVPVYEQAFASDVASKLLGREAFTGSTLLHYQEAVAATRGRQAYSEFIEQVRTDLVELHRLLGFGAIAPPWLVGPPAKQISEYEFLYGDPNGYWIVRRFDPKAKTFAVVRYSDPPTWKGPEAIRAAVEQMERAAENWSNSPAAQALEEQMLLWKRAAGEEFELLARGAMLSVPLNEQWLTACALVPDLVAAYLDAQVEIGRQQLQLQAKLGLRIAWAGGDLADNKGPVYGPKFFRRVVLPRYRRIIAAAHDLGMKYLFRSDGNIWPIADDLFADAGADGYGEIDHDAGMDIPQLQERYPRLTCWGNISCRLLREGTPEQVKQAACELVERCSGRGRLILGSSNTVLPGTPPENYLALLEAASGRT